MDIKVKIRNLNVWYRDSTKEWVVHADITSNNVHLSINFSNKKLNKSKKSFYKFCTQGILGEEMLYLFKEQQIHFNYL
jgi:hypothetical protein